MHQQIIQVKSRAWSRETNHAHIDAHRARQSASGRTPDVAPRDAENQESYNTHKSSVLHT
jgi:hypothetical protein